MRVYLAFLQWGEELLSVHRTQAGALAALKKHCDRDHNAKGEDPTHQFQPTDRNNFCYITRRELRQ